MIPVRTLLCKCKLRLVRLEMAVVVEPLHLLEQRTGPVVAKTIVNNYVSLLIEILTRRFRNFVMQTPIVARERPFVDAWIIGAHDGEL